MSIRDQELASEMIAARLRDPSYQDRLALSRSRETGESDEVAQDFINMTDVELLDKYGEAAQQQAWRVGQGANRVRDIDNSERTNTEVITDAGNAAAGAALRSSGNMSGLLAGWMVEKMSDGEISREQATADILTQHNNTMDTVLQDSMSETIQDKQRMFAVEGDLDSMDNDAEYEADVAAGVSPWMAAITREGKNALDTAERAWENPDVTGVIIAEGIGDLAISAPLGGAAGLVAKGASKVLVNKAINNRVSRAMAKVATAGAYGSGEALQESVGVYAESVNDVMSIPTERLMETSTIFQALVLDEGMTPEDARSHLAGLTAETAALRQAPASIALGFITSKFEAMPIGAFRDIGITRGLLQIAGEGIEEAGQGTTGTINRNLAVEEYAEIGRDTFKGIGEEAALGAIAGMGVAGVAATPATARGVLSAPRDAANALLAGEETYNDPLTQQIMGRGSNLAEASRAAAGIFNEVSTNVGRGTRAVGGDLAPAARATASAVGTVGRGAAAFAGDVMPYTGPVGRAAANAGRNAARGIKGATDFATEKLETYNNRDQSKQSKQEIQETVAAARVVDDMVQADNFDETLSAKIRGTDAKPPSGMSDTVGSNVVLTAANALGKMAQKGFNPTKEDKAFAAQQIATLKALGNSLPMKARRQIAKMVSSKEAQKVLSEATELDLNKETVSEENKVSTTINVAKTNPANVNPVETKKILEESGENISPEDAKYLRLSSSVAETINKAVGNIIGITEKMNVALKAQGRDEVKVATPETASRSILAEGYTNRKGENLRSVNDFVSDIVQGSQSPDGTIINQKGEVIPVRTIAEQFAKLLTHMNNKVEALNLSYDQNKTNAKGEMMASRGQRFRKLIDGENFIDPDKWTSDSGSVTYHRSRAGSVGFAERVELDRDVINEVYNQMAQEFPEIFDGLEIPSEMVPLKRDNTPPTGIEEVSAETDEQNQDNTNDEQPTAVEDEAAIAVSDEQNTDTSPTAVEEEGTTESVEDDVPDSAESEANAETDTEAETNEVVNSDEQILRNTYDLPDDAEIADAAMELEIKSKLISVLTPYLNRSVIDFLLENTVGFFSVFDSTISGRVHTKGELSMLGLRHDIMQDLLYGTLSKKQLHTVLHEMGHIVDSVYLKTEITDDGVVDREWFSDNTFIKEARTYVLNNMDTALSTFLTDYALSQSDTYKIKSELFAESFALALKDVERLKNDLPEIAKFFEGFIERINQESDSTFGSSETGPESSLVTEPERTDEELSLLLNNPSKWDADERKHIAKNIKAWRATAKAKLTEVLGAQLTSRVRSIKIYPASLAAEEGPGFANVNLNDGTQEIYLSADLFDENGELTPYGIAVALHEAAHVIDYSQPKYSDIPMWVSEMNTFRENGKVAKEFYALLTSNSYIQSRIDYVMGYQTDDPVQHKAEMFAVLSEFYLSKDGTILENSPETIAIMEEIYGPRENQKVLTEAESDVSEQSEEGTSEGTGTKTTAKRVVSEDLDRIYPVDKNTKAPETVADLQQMATDNGGLNQVILDKVALFAPKIMDAMNARLAKRRTNYNGKTASIADHIKDGNIWKVMQYRFTILADKETGQMNQNMVELATVAMVDWLANASPSDPNRLEDTLEKQGLSYADIQDQELQYVAMGLPSSTLKPQLANAILKMWGVKPNKAATMGEMYGIAEGLAAEMLLALESEGLYEVKRVPLTRMVEGFNNETGEKTLQVVKTDTVLLNMEKIREFQQEIRENSQEGVADTAKAYLFGDDRERYTFTQPKSKQRAGLSNRENKAVNTMEQTPHFYNEELGDLMQEVDTANLLKIFGYVENVNEDTVPNGTLRRSILGKNLSIENNLADAGMLIRQIDGKTKVYYPVGVTSVGRHQYEGVNPQTNKFLRMLVTPTWATVDIATQEDMVWLAVAQGADLAKIEKKNHAKILETIESDFLTRYGEAYKQARMKLAGKPFDADAFTASVLGDEDSVEPQVMAAIFTVAKMQHAKANGETSFESSLSVELDGLTNGAANMMVNFMQGILSESQFENFKRIGLYLGKTNKTINDFFGVPENLDMYETVARLAQRKLIQMLDGELSAEASAARRLAGHFGDFKKNEKTGEFDMTRNSAKNPMTKVNYGSGVMGVGSGLADDIMLKIFEAMHVDDLSDITYAGDLIADLKTMGIQIPTNAKASWEPSKVEMKSFRWNVSQTIGKALTEAAKETLGDKITEVNDMLVFSTNVQAAYLNEMFNTRIEARAWELVKEGKMELHPKYKKPVMRTMPVEEYDKIVKELEAMAPIFTSDEQTLELGGFKIKVATDWPVLSASMDDRLNQHPMLKQPDDVGVKAIPFTVIGTGDAMMMNLIFGQDNAPRDVLGIFDGLDVPLTKLGEYAPMANQRVAESWDRDVLAMVVENFRGFLTNGLDADALDRAYAVAKDKSKKSSVTAQNPTQLLEQLDNRLRQNRAFKAVLKKIPMSVDQMGGSDVGFSRGEGDLGLNAINDMIRRELAGNPVATVEEIDKVNVKEPVNETTVTAVLKGIRFTEAQKKILSLIEPTLTDTRVIFGTLDQLNVYRRENFPDDGRVLTAPAQYDPVNDVLFMTTATPETVLHELVHAATFNKVLAHYNGETNENVTRLETLMNEFLAITDGGSKVREAQASILMRKASTDPFDKAAAVNELMAYVLANAAVRRKAQNTQSNLVSSLGSKVIRLMRRLLGGAPESVFDGVAFSTAMLVGKPINDDSGDGGNGNGGGDNTGGDLTPPANNYTNYWIQLLANYLDSTKNSIVTQGVRMDEQVKVRDAVNNIVDSFRQVGMLQNQEARMTFKAIFGVINADIKLRGQPLIAMSKMYEHVIENMAPEMFGSGPEAAQEYSAVLNAFSANNDLINSVAVLLALSQTSAKFRNVLDQIPEPETGETSRKLQDTLTGLASATMDNITATVSEKGAPKEVMDALAAMIVEHDKDREWVMLRKVTNGLTKADDYVSGKMQQAAELMRQTDEETQASTRTKTRKILTSVLTLGTNYLDKTGTDLTNQALKDKVHMGIPFLSLVPIREMVAEMVGTDAINRKVVGLQDKVNFAISGMRQAYREDLPGIMARLFSEKPTKDQWKTMFNVIAKTDFTRIVDPNNMAASMQLISDAPTRNRRIRQLESQVELKLGPAISVDAKEKAEQLANYMNTGVVGKLLMRNAYAIAKNLDGDFDASLVPLLDELITIYAIDMQTSEQRQEIVDLYNNDTDAMEAMMTYMQRLNTEEDNKTNISEMAKLNAYKGYIPNEGNDTLRVVVDDDRNELDMKTKGFIKLKPYVGDPNSLIDKSYYISNVSSRGQYAQGALQYVAATYRGVDVNTGLSLNGNTTGFISGDGIVNRMIEALNDPSYTMENDKEGLIPVFDVDGTVSGFERAINPDILEQYAGRDENLAIMLGAWAGRQLEETTAYEYNLALIDELDAIWQNRERGSDALFVNLKDSKDPIYAESYRLIPQNVKAYIDGKFGGEGMLVRKDMANLSVGYREASLADMWTGKTRMPKEVQKAVVSVTQLFMGRNAMRNVVKAEEVLQGTISTAKDIIVIRSLVVPALNMQANVAQLATRGVPVKTMVKSFREKLAEVEAYNKNVTKIMELKAMADFKSRDANQKRILMDKIKVLEDLNNKMSIAPMIKAGAYKQLSEGITEFDKSITAGKLGDYVEAQAEKLPAGVRTIAQHGIVSKSTKMYQIANRATQYGDFLAKSIYYDHLLTKGLSPELAVSQINEEFVNFSSQPGRVRSGLERNGLSWFMAFKMRIAKIAMQQMRDNPVRALAVNAVFDVGSPIEDNILSVLMDGRLDYATGYEMLFAAPELNPWVNLLSD